MKIGFVGAGGMGSLQLQKILEQTDAEISALFEPNTENGRKALKSNNLPEEILVDSYKKIIENPEIDVVWLTSPNAYHGEQSIAAMEAGKHVFCEKPCATDFRDFRRQIELERSNPNLKTYVNYLMYFDPMENIIKRMVSDGAFGEITQIQINYRYPIGIGGNMAWKLSKKIMGDSLGMGIIHSLSAIVNIMSPQAKPASVYATNMESRVKGFEAEPIYNILIKFDNGASGFCFGNIESSDGLDIYHNLSGTEGGFVFDPQAHNEKGKVRYSSQKSTKGQWIWPLDSDRCREDGYENLAWSADTPLTDSGDAALFRVSECINHFTGCVKSNEKSFLSFENSMTIAEIGWAAQISAATDKEISLPLDWESAQNFFLRMDK